MCDAEREKNKSYINIWIGWCGWGKGNISIRIRAGIQENCSRSNTIPNKKMGKFNQLQ